MIYSGFMWTHMFGGRRDGEGREGEVYEWGGDEAIMMEKMEG